MSNTLVIEGVDFELLEKQRGILGRILYRNDTIQFLLEDERSALNGIVNAINTWSDIRYHEAKGDFKKANSLRQTTE